MARDWNIPAHESIDALLKEKHDFVVLSVPRAVTPDLILELTTKGAPSWSRTPPAAEVEDMSRLWQKLRKNARVQIAEQYPFQPLHAARLALAASGEARHDHPGADFGGPRLPCHGAHPPIPRHRLRAGRDQRLRIQVAHRRGTGPGRFFAHSKRVDRRIGPVIARLQFDGKLGIYDFTGDQYFSWIARSACWCGATG